MRGRSNFPLTNSFNSDKFHQKIYISTTLLNNIIQIKKKTTLSAQVDNIKDIRLTGGKYYGKI